MTIRPPFLPSSGGGNRIARMSTEPAAGQWRDTLLLERRSPVDG